jgi:uncharacterized protein YerC
MNQTLKNQLEKTLIETISNLSKEDLTVFLKDFLTESELESFSKRLSVAYWLRKKRSYENIQTNLKVSTRTIAQIQNLMKKEGFQKALKDMEAEEWANIWSEKIKGIVKP